MWIKWGHRGLRGLETFKGAPRQPGPGSIQRGWGSKVKLGIVYHNPYIGPHNFTIFLHSRHKNIEIYLILPYRANHANYSARLARLARLTKFMYISINLCLECLNNVNLVGP